MRTAVRLTLPCILLPILCAAAGARPQQSRRTARDARCKAAAGKYISAVSDKAHRTVEQQYRVEYDEARKYLTVCGESGDDFTLNLKKYAVRREA
ncbi:MAG TPA: hypothetical protein VKB12_11115 [Pyrinomonadaceae bacterium]|nr:hypothetical protein [Pyrinomonadaceae bacterium]